MNILQGTGDDKRVQQSTLDKRTQASLDSKTIEFKETTMTHAKERKRASRLRYQLPHDDADSTYQYM